MPRLIDADALIDDLEKIGRNLFNDIPLFRIIHNAPPIEAEVVVRCGEWIEVPYVYIGLKRYCCDQCSDDEYWESRYVNTKEKYCPNCGAKMDGGEKK